MLVSEDKIRLDVFLTANYEFSSRSEVQRLIKLGKVKVNNKIIDKPSFILLQGQEVDFEIPEIVRSDYLTPQDIHLDIVYEDEDVLVINKPKGILVHPGCGNKDNTLINGLIHYYGDQIINVGGKDRPGIVHRLDKDTSGLLVIAKNDLSFQNLVSQFSDRTISRKYTALVWGCTPYEGTWEKNIDRSKSDYKKMTVVHRGGKYALTKFTTLKNFGKLASLISCKLYTGRTHQIRVHANHHGFPLIGDPIYCKSNQKLCQKMPADVKNLLKTVNSQCLHARELSFIHPRTGKSISFTVENPDYITQIINCLDYNYNIE